MRKTKSYIGARFGRLTIIEDLPGQRSPRRRRRVLVGCAWGVEKWVDSSTVTGGYILSCGCLRNERVRLANSTHGESHTALYHCWKAMVQRCTNPHNRRWADY